MKHTSMLAGLAAVALSAITFTSGSAEAAAPPTTAPTSTPRSYQPLPPRRVADSRIGQGFGYLGADSVTVLDVTNDPAASAVTVTITATEPSTGGYITAYNCGQRPVTSSVNFTDRSVANFAVVPVTAAGEICLYAKSATHAIVDLSGVITASPSADLGTFVNINPARLADTRVGQPGTRVGAGGTLAVQVSGRAGVARNATAAVLNVTAVSPSGAGYLTAFPCDTGRPLASMNNFVAGEVLASAAIVPLSADGNVCVFTSATTDLLIDVTGYIFDGRTGDNYTPVVPIRMADTRSPDGAMNHGTGGAQVGSEQVLRIPISGQRGIPAGATAATVNLTSVSPAGLGFLTAWSCGARPGVSNVNYGAAGSPPVLSNSATVPLTGAGELCVYVKTTTHVLVDVTGVWTPSGVSAGVRKNIVTMGDSWTYPINRDWYDWLMWADPDARLNVIHNAGVPGDTTAGMLSRFTGEVLYRWPNVVAILGGINDVGKNYSAQTIITNLSAMYDMAYNQGISIVAVTLPPFYMNPAQRQVHAEVNNWIRTQAPVRWAGRLTVGDWNNALATPGTAGQDGNGAYYRDLIHPNANGARTGGRALRAVFAGA